MSQNIDLGTFIWDSAKLTDQIAANYLEIQRFSAGLKKTQDELKKTGKAVSDLENRVESEYKQQEELNRALEEGKITQDQYTKAIDDSNIVISEAVDEQVKLIKAQSDYVISTMKTQNEIKALKQEQSELNKLMQAGQTELNGSERAYAEVSQRLAEAKLDAKNLGAQLLLLGETTDKNSTEYKQLSARYDEAATKADKLNTQLKTLDNSVGDNQRNVGAYKEAIKSAFSEITQGAMQMASGDIAGGFDGIKNGFTGIKTAAAETYTALLANPITALLVVFAAVTAGIAAGVKEIFDYNAAIKENVILTENLTGATGQLADDIRIRAQALSDTFGGEFKEVIQTANVLAKQLGITYEEAFNKIEQGYARGANASGDFLERLKEYGPLLNKYGFDINEIIGLQIQAQEQGLFNDKFEDSLKEAGLSLQEFTKSQSDALTSGFGKEFSDKISKDVNSGVLSVKDALLLMSQEAKKQGLSVQQFGILTADVFKGAGEDVGGAQVIFENIFAGINKLDEPLTRVQQRTLDLSQANYELAKAKDEALKSDSILDFQNAWDIAVAKITTGFYKFIDSLIDGIKWFDELTGSSEALFSIYETGQEYVSVIKGIFDELVGTFNELLEALGLNDSGAGSFLKTIFSFFNPLNTLKILFKGLVGVLKGVQATISNVRIDVVAFVNTVKIIFGQLSDAISSFDISSPIESLKKFAAINITGTFQKAKKEAADAIKVKKELDKAFKDEVPTPKDTTPKVKSATQAEKDAAVKAAADAAKAAEAEAKKNEAKRIADARKAAADAKKALEEENKRQLEILKEYALQKVDVAKSELAEYISLNADRYKDDKTLLNKKLVDQIAYFEEVKRLQLIANDEERKAKEFSIQQKIDELEAKKVLNENDKAEIINLKAEIANIDREYAIKEIDLTKQTDEKKKEVNKKYEEDVQAQKDLAQAISFQKRILDLENEGASETEIRQVQLEQKTQQELNAFLEANDLKRTADQENYDINQEIENQRRELENQIALVNDENEKLRLQNKLDGLNLIEKQNAADSKKIVEVTEEAKLSAIGNTFGQVSTLLGKNTAAGKAAGIAQATINTYQGVTEVWKTPSTLPEPFATISKIVSTATVLASGLGAVRQITAVGVPKAEKGMLIHGPSHINGGVPINTPNGPIEAEGGEIIINKNSSRLFASELSDINQAGGGRKLFAGGGIVSGKLAGVQNSISSGIDVDLMAEKIGNAVAEGAASGTSTGSQKGIENLNSNIKIQEGANF